MVVNFRRIERNVCWYRGGSPGLNDTTFVSNFLRQATSLQNKNPNICSLPVIIHFSQLHINFSRFKETANTESERWKFKMPHPNANYRMKYKYRRRLYIHVIITHYSHVTYNKWQLPFKISHNIFKASDPAIKHMCKYFML